jgi:ADP-ribose pyrophosphatase YjhB (NUDIX family)
MFEKNSHCSYCGHGFAGNAPWPRLCAHCGNISFVNPLPVAVMLVPVDEGLIVIRRGIEPRKGMLALPGGYINLGESWQQAGAREVYEETGIALAADEIKEFGVRSAEDGTLLIFGLASLRTSSDLPPFSPTGETTERAIVTEPLELAFALHSEMVVQFFRSHADLVQKPPLNSILV